MSLLYCTQIVRVYIPLYPTTLLHLTVYFGFSLMALVWRNTRPPLPFFGLSGRGIVGKGVSGTGGSKWCGVGDCWDLEDQIRGGNLCAWVAFTRVASVGPGHWLSIILCVCVYGKKADWREV